jgi:hypothetical protein
MFGDVQISQCPGLVVENTYVASWTTMKQSVRPDGKIWYWTTPPGCV